MSHMLHHDPKGGCPLVVTIRSNIVAIDHHRTEPTVGDYLARRDYLVDLPELEPGAEPPEPALAPDKLRGAVKSAVGSWRNWLVGKRAGYVVTIKLVEIREYPDAEEHLRLCCEYQLTDAEGHEIARVEILRSDEAPNGIQSFSRAVHNAAIAICTG